MVEEDRDDFVKLIDFGFAKVPMDRIGTIEKKASLKDMKVTAMGTIFGTPSYMPPEIALGMDAVDERSDLYAFGVILYEMLAGAHPFDTKDPSALLLKHRTVVPPPIAERTGVDVPPAMEAIAMRLMMKDPTLRYPSAAAVVEAIDEAMGGAQPSRKPPSTQPPPPGSSPPGSSPPQASSQPSPPGSSPPQASSQPSPQVSSQPSPQASSPPQALSPPSEPSAAPAVAAAPNPAIAPKPGEPTPRPRGAKPSASRTAVPRWALPAAFLSLLAAIGVVVIALRSLDPPAPTVQRDTSAPPVATATATVTAPPSAAPAPSAAPSVSEPRSDATLAPLRADMRAAADSKEWDRGAEALVQLADRDPNAFEDRDIARAAVGIAAGITLGADKRADADKVFDALSTKLGAAGLDILYDIVSTRGGSNAASRASKILRNKKVLERASPALRIAIELRDAPSCKERLALLDRAKKDGDTRAVAVLDIWRAQRCIAGAGECCFRTNSAVDDTMKQIWTRVRSSPTQ
jgi:serine/threonine-protein kinase